MKRTDKNKKIVKNVNHENLEIKVSHTFRKVFKFFSYLIVFSFFIYLLLYIVGTAGLFVKEYSPEFNNLPKSFHGFKIVHFSDIHYGSSTNIKKLRLLKTKINDINPDIIVFTGDLFEKIPNESEKKLILEIFKSMKSKYGNYFVLGNHDQHNEEKFLLNANWINLNNNYQVLSSSKDEIIVLNGIDDHILNRENIDKAYQYDNKELFNILLVHEPDRLDVVLNKYNPSMALAGHSHGGQIRIPFINKSILRIPGSFKYPDDFYQINNTSLYVSSGIGTTFVPLRLANHPSFNLIRMRSSQK